MTRRLRTIALLAIAVMAAVPSAAATAREMYAAATARAKTVRNAADEGVAASAKDYRRAAAAFEAVVRRHPTTGYADNALIEAAALARQAHERFRETRDKDYALRLLNWLLEEYPSSPLVPKAREELKRWEMPAAKMAAVAPATASATVSAKSELVPSPEPGDAGGQGSTALLKSIRRSVTGDIVRVTIELDSEVTYRTERVENPPRVLFDLQSVRPAPTLSEGTMTFSGDAVRHIRIGRHPNRVLRVVLDLQGVKKYSVFSLYEPYRIIVDCESAPALPPVPSERITEDKLRPPIADPEAPASPASAGPPPVADVKTPKSELPTRPAGAPKREPAVRAEARPLEGTPRYEAATKPALPRVLPGRPLVTTDRWIAPVTQRLPVLLASDPPAPAPPPPAPPLRVIRQFRATRNPSWQPTVIAPQPLPADSAAIIAPPAAPTAAAVAAAVDSPTPAAERPAMATAPVEPPPNGFSMARQLGLGASRIVIDPGHGGHDPGAEGAGIFEATIVLDVALRLEKLLTAAGIEVVLTRRTDEYIPLEERTAIANRTQGDLFLSIHANASRNRAARGIESYVLNFATTPDAEAVAARENASTGLTMNSLTDIVKAIALNNKLDESRNFAGIIQRELVSHLGGTNKDLRNHGVKQAPFVVLIGASMPSVLAEISFITNAQEGRLLKTPAYRQKIAAALLDAIRGYQKSLKGAPVLTRQ